MQSSTGSSQSSVRYEGGTANALPLEGTDTAEILVNDHRVIKQLLQRLCDASESGTRLTTLNQLKAAFTIHNSMEENLVYPALQSVAGKKHEAQKLYHETAEADVLVFELDTMLKTGDTSDFDGVARKLQAAVLEHIDDEEQKAIPDLREHASSEQAQLLTRNVREFRQNINVQIPA